MTLRKINFEEGHVLVSEYNGRAKLAFHPEEDINQLWEEVKVWLAKQNLEHTILIGRLRRLKKSQPYCLAWERRT
tara:strand:- start:4947 stop:5171 length:225 start_codon:yes stop_codon:yes gene_type:complete